MFDQFCPKAGNANPLVAEPEIDFNARWPFKVIYFGIIEEPCTNGLQYIAQYYKCGFTRCEGSEDIASERSENRHFRPPISFDAPLQRTTANIRIKIILLETIGSLQGYIFAADSMGLSAFRF